MSASIKEGTQIASGFYTGLMSATTTVGCFSTPTPLVDHGPYEFQSGGNCQKICYHLNQPVMGLWNGKNCACGSLLPPKSSQVNDSNCDTPCVGWPKDSCGAADYYWVVLTGLTANKIANLNAQEESSSETETKTQASVVTVGGSTVYQTVAPTGETSKKSGGGGSNTVGIAVGVVVGVVAIAAIIGAVVFLLKRRRRQEAEDEYQQKQSVQQFVAGGKNPMVMYTNTSGSTGDSRLDPEFVMHRRQSDGSIMDNQDYSRRILRVSSSLFSERRIPATGDSLLTTVLQVANPSDN